MLHDRELHALFWCDLDIADWPRSTPKSLQVDAVIIGLDAEIIRTVDGVLVLAAFKRAAKSGGA